MKPVKTILICIAVTAAVLVSGCAKPPVEEMNQAAEAVARAEKDINAVTHAPNSVTRARDSLARMYSEAESKRYDAARSFAAEAISAANRAIEEGRAGAERVREEANLLVSELRPLIAETEQGLDAAKAAGLPLDFDTLNNEYNGAVEKAGQAQSSLNAGRYQDCIEQGRAARSDLNGINRQLASTASVVGSGKK